MNGNDSAYAVPPTGDLFYLPPICVLSKRNDNYDQTTAQSKDSRALEFHAPPNSSRDKSVGVDTGQWLPGILQITSDREPIN